VLQTGKTSRPRFALIALPGQNSAAPSFAVPRPRCVARTAEWNEIVRIEEQFEILLAMHAVM
jgi:hypothetical protein